ncbi:hypothetical protein J4456_02290 [Candidatus Pacearchaeota archaeon]|nr:hypothetical protein [Candidatus Pacearchaeota archaeon]
MKKTVKRKQSFRKRKEGKHGALELSIGTIVILVLAMSMLILGLVLVRTIFTGAKYNVDTMNKKVEAEINKLFVEEQRAVIFLPNRIAEIKQGDEFGLGFGIQNAVRTQKFRWQVEVNDDNIRKKCGITDRQAEEWVTTGGTGSVDLASGQKYYDVLRFNVAEGSVSDISTCIIRYRLVIKQEDGLPYTTESFDVDIS